MNLFLKFYSILIPHSNMSVTINWRDSFGLKLPTSAMGGSTLAKISISKGETSKYSLARISFYFGNYAQRFKKSELDFLIKNLQNKGVLSLSNDESITKKIVFHRLNDGSATFANVDGGKVFGIHLQMSEIDNFLNIEKVFAFLLEKVNLNPHISGTDDLTLKGVMTGTFVYVIFREVLKQLVEKCEGCNNKTPIDQTHFCKNLNWNRGLVSNTIKQVVQLNQIKSEFERRFDRLAEALFLTSKQKEELRKEVQKLIENDEEIVSEIIYYKEFSQGKAKLVDDFWEAYDSIPENYFI